MARGTRRRLRLIASRHNYRSIPSCASAPFNALFFRLAMRRSMPAFLQFLWNFRRIVGKLQTILSWLIPLLTRDQPFFSFARIAANHRSLWVKDNERLLGRRQG